MAERRKEAGEWTALIQDLERRKSEARAMGGPEKVAPCVRPSALAAR